MIRIKNETKHLKHESSPVSFVFFRHFHPPKASYLFPLLPQVSHRSSFPIHLSPLSPQPLFDTKRLKLFTRDGGHTIFEGSAPDSPGVKSCNLIMQPIRAHHVLISQSKASANQSTANHLIGQPLASSAITSPASYPVNQSHHPSLIDQPIKSLDQS